MQLRPPEHRSFTDGAPTLRRTDSERLLEAWVRAADLIGDMGTARERAYARLVLDGLRATTKHHLQGGA